jgi:hypothetical protein
MNGQHKSVQFDDNVIIIYYNAREKIVKKNKFKKLLECLSKLWKKQ